MLIRNCLLSTACCLVLAACGSGSGSDRAAPAPPATNNDGTVTTAVVTAIFDPSNGVVPLPNNLLFSGTNDLTLNAPFDPDSSTASTFQALNGLDGWGTTSPWNIGFDSPIDASTVVPGQTVRWFEVQLNQPGGAVVGVVRELTPFVEYVTSVSTTNALQPSVLLVPLQPLDEITTYMAVVTDGITDPQGNNVTPSQTYFIAKRTTPLLNSAGQSTDPLLPDATAQALEPLRQLTNAQEAAAASAGVPADSIVVSWTATTQSITPVLQAAYTQVAPRPVTVAPTGLDTSAVGGAGIADIFIGITSVPYYLEAPSAENPTAPLNGFWEAAPGAYIPPFNAFGLDPTSTNITFLNPFPVAKSDQTIPVLMTLPNANSGQTMPASGWPVVIFQHGITRNRTDALALADSMAQAGFAVVSIDQPLHGIGGTVDPATGTVIPPEANPLYIENTPLGPLASERTFDLDLQDNLTGAPGPDGNIDASGTYSINLTSLRTARDNNRQASIDIAQLAASLGNIQSGGQFLDPSQVRFVGQSLGSIVGIPFLTVDPTVNTGVFSVPGGGIVGLLLGSPTFGPRIVQGLASVGVEQGSADFELFVVAAQTVLDSADPINWGHLTPAANDGVLLQEVIGSDVSLPDQVIPNSVPGFPLSGTEPLIRRMQLAPITQSTQSASGIFGVTRFVVGDHGSLLSPAASLEATIEMQTEAASMVVSGGRAVEVPFPSVLQGN